MPVILPTDGIDAWLSGEAVPLCSYPAEEMSPQPVIALVNKPANNDSRWVDFVVAAWRSG